MSSISEIKWKKALTSITEELNDSQFYKLVDFLEIPQHERTESRARMPQIIIERYGVEKSIHKMNEAMDYIPRRDNAIQGLLRPLVDELENKQEAEEQGRKRKHSESDSKSDNKKSKAVFEKNNIVSDSSSDEEEDEADEPNTPLPNKEVKIPSWRKSIHDLQISGDCGKKPIAGKVVKKSGLRTYQTKSKEKKFFFYLGVADEISSIKVMVYGKERFQFFQEGHFYMFRAVILDKNVVKVTKMSRISKTSHFDVPENLEMEAQMLIYFQSPVCSIMQANSFKEKTSVSVEGTVTELNPVENIKLKTKRRKKEKQEFKLEDGTGSIGITLWGEDTKQLRQISQGDFVRVINVKTSYYYDKVSLNSTDFTRIFKVQSAAIQNVEILIIGINKANKIQTELEAQIGQNGEVQSLVVASPLLAEVFSVRLEGNLEERLLEKMPFSAEAEIKGNKINTIKAANKL